MRGILMEFIAITSLVLTSIHCWQLHHNSVGFSLYSSKSHAKFAFKMHSTRNHRGTGNVQRYYNNVQQKDIRRQRAARILRDELSDIISSGDFEGGSSSFLVDDGLLSSVTISSVDVNADLSVAKVYLTIGGNSIERRKVFVWLCKHLGQLRHSLHTRMRNFKRVPTITLHLTDTITEDFLDQAFDEISRESSIGGDNFSFGDVQFEEIADEEDDYYDDEDYE